MAIEFYRERDKPYGCFSNFSKHGFTLGGKSWLTVEHYFQAQKFPGMLQEERIRLAPDPMTAKTLGNDRTVPLRSDWQIAKDAVMFEAVWAKFTQNLDLQLVLVKTGDEVLIEAAYNDSYWGSGPDGRGRNKLGLTLMEVRNRLR